VQRGPELAYSVDRGSWPIVSIAATPSVADDQALEATYAALTLMLSRRQHFGAVIDVRGAVSNAKRRKRMSAWVEENRHVLDHFLVGVAPVVDTALERGVVTAALWLIPTPVRIQVFGDRGAAETWIRERIASR
jgi:hypothetical protein